MEEHFDDLVSVLLGLFWVTPPGGLSSGFSRDALRERNKIFAMLVRGRLVVR